MKLTSTLACALLFLMPTVLWAAPVLVDPDTQAANEEAAKVAKDTADSTERYRSMMDTQRQKSTDDTQRQTSTTDSTHQTGSVEERQKGQAQERQKGDTNSSQRGDGEVNVQ